MDFSNYSEPGLGAAAVIIFTLGMSFAFILAWII
jgi:hypothetical protein